MVLCYPIDIFQITSDANQHACCHIVLLYRASTDVAPNEYQSVEENSSANKQIRHACETMRTYSDAVPDAADINTPDQVAICQHQGFLRNAAWLNAAHLPAAILE